MKKIVRPRQMKAVEHNVIEAARERVSLLFDRFDTVHVSFSGGKDSTVCLHLCQEEAVRRGRTVEVVFWDEEAIHPETIEYVERASTMPNVNFWWLCVPVQHRNACSRSSPYWYPWDPTKESLWCRPHPENGIRTLRGFKRGMAMPESVHLVHQDVKKYGSVALVRGLRAAESIRRLQAVTRRTVDNWISQAPTHNAHLASPIYDWSDSDVWTAPRLYGWDYNRTYDLFAAIGVAPTNQRVCPPYGEEPLGGLYQYAMCWPDLWAKMIERVPGAATAARYARTELYAYGKTVKPTGMTWREFAYASLEFYNPTERAQIAENMAALMKIHRTRTKRPMEDEHADPLTGVSWKFLAEMVVRGDMKGRRRQMVTYKAIQRRRQLGITEADVAE